MDHTDQWRQFLAGSPEIQGGALMTTDGVLIRCAKFGSSIDRKIWMARCAAAVAIAQQLYEGVGWGEFEERILEGENGYTILVTFLERAVLIALADKQAKLGLVVLEMRRAIDHLFGPGLAAEPLIPRQPPDHDRAYARIDND